MTWTKTGTDDTYGVVDVGCGHTSGAGNQCNPYNGDTICSAILPVLCFYDAKLAKPVNLDDSSVYHKWSGGIVATTEAVAGSSFDSIKDADAFCVKTFGEGWRVAEFHDGWGWYLKAYGNFGDGFDHARNRAWVHINDQPDATCWTP
ncbi:hypothetical protein QUF90_18570 [Desulfococcaceae bacterium HSG9]|nr:hypothetical protein [Desulfococcaceae bacterium HSG9]